MKKLRATISLFILVILISRTVLAGDIPESILKGFISHSGMIIGEIVNLDKGEVYTNTVFRGDLEEGETIKLQIPSNYYGTDDLPKNGDYIVAVLLDNNTKIYNDWFFKTSSTDYETLKLVSEKYTMVISYNEYINDGKYFQNIDENSIEASENIETISINLNERQDDESDNNSFSNFYLVVISFFVLFYIFRVFEKIN